MLQVAPPGEETETILNHSSITGPLWILSDIFSSRAAKTDLEKIVIDTGGRIFSKAHHQNRVFPTPEKNCFHFFPSACS